MDKEYLGPDTFEGTWEELTQVAPRFNGHRLRLTVLREAKPSPFIRPKVNTNYAAKILEELSQLPPATPEEIREAEEEYLEFQRAMNETRRRAGAEILYPDV